MASAKAFDSNTGQFPQWSGYDQLKSRSIRLLQPDSAAPTCVPLDYTFKMVDLDLSPVYKAVSYCWGAPVPERALKLITIDHKPVRLRPTLYSFLESITTIDPKAALWIDAVCINQDDVLERNSQVSLMGEIYSLAQQVYVWLGSGDDNTVYAIEHASDDAPETHYDEIIFSSCVERLFQSPYWSRRWVLQEFALSKSIAVVCSSRSTMWTNLVDRITLGMLRNDARASQHFEDFVALRGLTSSKHTSLIELMQRFQHARCVDTRDKAFALRAVAQDGALLTPHYDESVADLFFRLLSMLPLARVVPPTLGYRWPHPNAEHLITLLGVTRRDLFSSLSACADDKHFCVMERVGCITDVISTEADRKEFVKIDYAGSCTLQPQMWLRRNASILHEHYVRLVTYDDVCPGDIVFVMAGSHRLAPGRLTPDLLLVFRSETASPIPDAILLLIDDRYNDANPSLLYVPDHELIRQVVLGGIQSCQRKTTATTSSARKIFHMNRPTLVLVWLTYAMQLEGLTFLEREVLREVTVAQGRPHCGCIEPALKMGPMRSNRALLQPIYGLPTLDILPSIEFQDEPPFYATLATPPWTDSVTSPPLSLCHSDSRAGLKKQLTAIPASELTYAAACGHGDYVAHLTSTNASKINASDSHGCLALLAAASSGEKEIVENLLSCGADVHARGSVVLRGFHIRTSLTALEAACAHGHFEIVECLLMHASCEWLGDARIPRSTVRQYRDVDTRSTSGRSATDSEDSEVGDTSYTAEDLGSALCYAVSSNSTDVIRLLLECGAEVNLDKDADDGEGCENPLLEAANLGLTGVMQLLADHGANMDLELGSDKTHVLGRFCFGPVCQHPGTAVGLLLDLGADINHQDGWGRTALYIAILTISETPEFRGRQVVKVLLERGADPNISDENCRTPLDVAKDYDEYRIVKLLRAHGAKDGIGPPSRDSSFPDDDFMATWSPS